MRARDASEATSAATAGVAPSRSGRVRRPGQWRRGLHTVVTLVNTTLKCKFLKPRRQFYLRSRREFDSKMWLKCFRIVKTHKREERIIEGERSDEERTELR